ncbi:hypothetical protein [Blastopirellula marina]|uniref:Uncharacterized protein n=1 Tax=Blastopirellula marina DSM 3645 TaxID=314230 RepID=A3ZSL7_9BACT|nr:hypothetical protein [Blastopirellula marina]EAQ80677.1 hypothetical protein DSM3645_15065 [Blastopirellula marina DSM 3645]
MTQNQIDRLVAETLGENLRDIQRLGFTLISPDQDDLNEESVEYLPQVLDWDCVEGEWATPVATDLPRLVGAFSR